MTQIDPTTLINRPLSRVRARVMARAAASYEHALTGENPRWITIVSAGDLVIVTLQGTYGRENGSAGNRSLQSSSIARSLDGLRRYIRGVSGIDLRSAVWSADPLNASLCKTLATHASLDVFQLGHGIPLLGVPIDTHLHADGPRADAPRGSQAEGTGSEGRRDPIAMPSD
jgi:hypothetical protein